MPVSRNSLSDKYWGAVAALWGPWWRVHYMRQCLAERAVFFCCSFLLRSAVNPCYVDPCHHGKECPRVADGETASRYGG